VSKDGHGNHGVAQVTGLVLLFSNCHEVTGLLSCRPVEGSHPHLTPPGLPRLGGVSSIAGSGRLSLLLSSPIPQCEFDPIAYSNLVVDFFKMVPDDIFADPKFLSDILIFQSLGY
jgi:hypothetical protein